MSGLACRGLVVLVAGSCFACSGGESMNPVQGKVLYKDKPLKGVGVTFHPKGPDDLKALRPGGMTGEDGSFTLSTGDKPGAPAGEYVVTFTCWEDPAPPKNKKVFSTSMPEAQDRFRGAYADPKTSQFKVEIKKGTNQLEAFQLK